MNFQWKAAARRLAAHRNSGRRELLEHGSVARRNGVAPGIHQHPDRQTAFEALDQGVRDDIVFHHVERHVNPGTLVGDEREQGSAAVLERGVTQALGRTERLARSAAITNSAHDNATG